jgi:hypothetical protein
MTDTETVATAELARLCEAYFATQHSYDPYNATLLGVGEFDGLSFDPSREASERTAQELAAIGRQVREIDTAGLAGAQCVGHGVPTALVEGARSDAENSLRAANASVKSYVSRQGGLRERAQYTLGPRFDLRRFHHAVLRNGAIALTLLDVPRRWTTTEA